MDYSRQAVSASLVPNKAPEIERKLKSSPMFSTSKTLSKEDPLPSTPSRKLFLYQKSLIQSWQEIWVSASTEGKN
jgi:hypothetical protein